MKEIKRPIIKDYFPNASLEDMQKVYVDNPELWSYIQSLDAYCDDLESKNLSQIRETINEIKTNKELKTKIKDLIFKNISQLEAVKILFGLMATGSTHRQKELFCQQSKSVIDFEISSLKSELDINGGNLPF